jgi:hypothetical protein
MTETQWLAATEPEGMLWSLRDRESARKLRLFGVACCRRIWPTLDDPRSRKAVEVAERFADGLVSLKKLETAHAAAVEVAAGLDPLGSRWAPSGRHRFHPAVLAANLAQTSVDVPRILRVALDARLAASDGGRKEGQAQADLLREVFGNPFRRVAVRPAWRRWADGTVPRVAAGLYQEGAFHRLAILADALEDAGCTEARLLAHLRGPGPHVRGCWALDLILEKE